MTLNECKQSSISAFVNPIFTTEKPLLIIAGPGAGKTYALVERTVQLVKQGIKAENIMVATFTEKAAKELVTRISNRFLELNFKVNLNEMYIGTLHSIFLRFLEENREYTRLKKSYRVLDDFEQKYFVYRYINVFLSIDGSELLLGTYKGGKWQKAQKVIGYVSKITEECLNADELIKSDIPAIQVMGHFQKIYQEKLSEENCLDFSNIQSEILHLLENQPQVLEKLQDKIQYFMVDEYQDTNTIQERILLLLAKKHNRVCVVGDDDQGLYRFRGATIRNILEFPQNFADGECQKAELVTNYRSHPHIIDFYNKWMQEISWEEDGKMFRFSKKVKPRDAEFVDNPSVIKVSSKGSPATYYDEVYKFIKTLKDSGKVTDYNQIAFLFRSVKHDDAIGLASYLEERDIKIFSPRSALFFEREEIQLLLGAIIFIFPNLFEDLKWNEEAKLDIWDTYEQWKARFANEVRKDLNKHKELLQWCQRRAKEHLTLTKNTNYGFAALLYQLLEYPLFSEFLGVDLKDNKVNLRASYNIALLSRLLFKFEYIYNVTVLTSQNMALTLRKLFNNFLRFIVEGGIEEYEDFDEYAPSGCVSFMTIHQSKGLEFPIVVVDSLYSVPRKQFDETDVILQDRYYSKPPFEPIEKTKFYDFYRLFYTAFSRSQNLLVLSTREEQKVNGELKIPSEPFRKLYNEIPSWRNKNFDITKLDLESIKPVHIKHQYSFTSHILLYENCPLQYKFYKELEFVEVRTGGVLGGSLLHQTIEDIHKAVLRGEEHTLTNENITSWYNTNYYLLSKQQRSYLHRAQIESLLQQILRYRDKNSDKWHRIKEAEVDVSLVKEDYILKGSIDLIEGENDTVEIIDFKSGNKPDINSTEEITRKLLNQYKRQLEVYGYLVEERTGYKVSKLHLYYPKEESGSPYITFKFDEGQISETIQTFDTVVKKIEAKDFDATKVKKSEKLCGDCDMRFHCNPRQY
jgi:DNA helicase-2/ATP-dependent DNA helicase PcrA